MKRRTTRSRTNPSHSSKEHPLEVVKPKRKRPSQRDESYKPKMPLDVPEGE